MTRMTTPFEFNVGDRFNPNDEELTYHYLMQKLLGNDHLVSRIPLLDLYQFDPSDLPYSDDGEGHFFSPLHPKFLGTNNGRINRSTGAGSWLATGKHCEITSQHNGEVNSGIRKIYVYFKDGIKYVMHEYSIPNLSTSLVLCKVMKKMPSKKSEGTCKKVKKRKEAAELPLPICNEDNSTLASSVMKKKMSVKKSEGPSKKVKRTDEKADMPYNKDNFTPVPNEGSDLQNWITSDKSDFSTYNNIIDNKDQQTEKSTCDNGGIPASAYPVADFTTLEDQVDPEMLPHLQSFLGYDQLDYSRYDFTQVDPPLTEQVSTNNGPAGTSMFDPEEDLFDTLWP